MRVLLSSAGAKVVALVGHRIAGSRAPVRADAGGCGGGRTARAARAADGGFVVTQNGGIDFSIFEIFGTLRIVADDFWAPNGIVLEPDGETLLVVEHGRHGEGHGFVRLHPDGLPLHAAPARQPGI